MGACGHTGHDPPWAMLARTCVIGGTQDGIADQPGAEASEHKSTVQAKVASCALSAVEQAGAAKSAPTDTAKRKDLICIPGSYRLLAAWLFTNRSAEFFYHALDGPFYHAL
jgi:hypothetical protein